VRGYFYLAPQQGRGGGSILKKLPNKNLTWCRVESERGGGGRHCLGGARGRGGRGGHWEPKNKKKKKKKGEGSGGMPDDGFQGGEGRANRRETKARGAAEQGRKKGEASEIRGMLKTSAIKKARQGLRLWSLARCWGESPGNRKNGLWDSLGPEGGIGVIDS